MRTGFVLAVLALASAYTFYAFAELDYLSSAGRLGPGFFPRFIGVALVALCLYSLAAEWKLEGDSGALSRFWRVTVVLGGLSAAFVAALEVLGGLVSMIAFMATALAILNRGRLLQNTLIAFALPIGIYLLFRLWLNAAIPRGALPLPF